jgi:hypothetical protein
MERGGKQATEEGRESALRHPPDQRKYVAAQVRGRGLPAEPSNGKMVSALVNLECR